MLMQQSHGQIQLLLMMSLFQFGLVRVSSTSQASNNEAEVSVAVPSHIPGLNIEEHASVLDAVVDPPVSASNR
jgi:hypothetical protein